MYFSKILAISFCVLIFTATVNAGGSCFIVSNNNHVLWEEGNCDTGYPPCSTFKIAISLMGFDSGILADETRPEWDFKPGCVDWLDRWKKPHNPKLWLANSCVWYSQIITKKLGVELFGEYVRRFNYGNKDISGDKGMDNGLTNCWLSSSLSISPREQIHFLERLVANRLPVSSEAHEMTRNNMFVEDLANGWKLYGKTGSGTQLDDDGNRVQDKQVGWFIGFVIKSEKVVTFVYLIADDEKQESYASLRAKAALKNRIGSLLIDFEQVR